MSIGSIIKWTLGIMFLFLVITVVLGLIWNYSDQYRAWVYSGAREGAPVPSVLHAISTAGSALINGLMTNKWEPTPVTEGSKICECTYRCTAICRGTSCQVMECKDFTCRCS